MAIDWTAVSEREDGTLNWPITPQRLLIIETVIEHGPMIEDDLKTWLNKKHINEQIRFLEGVGMLERNGWPYLISATPYCKRHFSKVAEMDIAAFEWV